MSEWHTGWTEGYASARSEAQAEITSLRAENEKLREENDAWRMDGASCSEEVKRLRAENEKLRAALKPFSDAAEYMGSGWDDDDRVGVGCLVGDLRAAKEAIGKING